MYSLRELEFLFDLQNYVALKQEILQLDEKIKQSPLNDLIDRRSSLCCRVAEVERRLAACPAVCRKFLCDRYILGKDYLHIANDLSYTPEYCRGWLRVRSLKTYLIG